MTVATLKDPRFSFSMRYGQSGDETTKSKTFNYINYDIDGEAASQPSPLGADVNLIAQFAADVVASVTGGVLNQYATSLNEYRTIEP